MSLEPWSNKPKVDELSLTDILMRRVPTSAVLNQEIPVSDVVSFIEGSAIVHVASEADLPPLIDGFRTLEINKNYLFTEPAVYTDNILIPAGWTGWIKNSFLTPTTVTFSGSTAFFATLNIDGIIDSIADSVTSPSTKSTITTNVAHGLLDGQFVNITDTTVEVGYTQQSLQVSNVTATTFDVEIPFTNTDSGLFNTGYGTVLFIDFVAENDSGAGFVNITSAGVVGSLLLITRCSFAGFQILGAINNPPNVIIRDGIFGFSSGGIILDNCINGAIETINFLNSNPANTTAIALTITGDETKRIEISTCPFEMANADQRPVRVDNSVTNAEEIVILNSPDNNVADEYYDTSGGGLDQTDPQVIAINNGLRADSENRASVIVVGNTTSFAPSIGSLGSFDFGTSANLGVGAELWELVSSQTGRVRYIGLKPFAGTINWHLIIDSGAATLYTVGFIKNATLLPEIIGPVNVPEPTNVGYTADVTAINGDEFEPQIMVNTGTDTIIIPNMAFTIQ